MPSVVKALAKAGLVIGAILTLIGLLARWFPALDIVNNGLPFLLAGTLVVAILAGLARSGLLAVLAVLLVIVNCTHFTLALEGGAQDAPAGAPRFLRVVTFNVWHHNDRIEDVAKFLADTDADLVVMQEMTSASWAKLREALGARYPYSLGDYGLVILSKYNIIENGRVDRGGMPPWASLMLRFAKIEVKGTQVTFAGAHLARPFYPKLQYSDALSLVNFVRQQHGPLILAGDFNMSPWTDKLTGFTQATGLERYNTFHFTWPLHARGLTLLPFVAIDHVFASPDFAKIATDVGPRLGSDHRAVIADIALASSGAK
jgi:endonuclease/exonuclease/phosphatase (EEP) superfamily protein YafD